MIYFLLYLQAGGMKPDLKQDLPTPFFCSNGQDVNWGGGWRHRPAVSETSTLDERDPKRGKSAGAKYGRGRLTPRKGRQLQGRRRRNAH